MVSTVSPKGEAHLLVYQLKLFSASHKYTADLNNTLRKFTSKPITQVGLRTELGGVGRHWCGLFGLARVYCSYCVIDYCMKRCVWFFCDNEVVGVSVVV